MKYLRAATERNKILMHDLGYFMTLQVENFAPYSCALPTYLAPTVVHYLPSLQHTFSWCKFMCNLGR